ncbi:hypothetical protein BDV93DRAFT_517678 [Ceratobasidium sp. AG-I]|nr:hypothetical protein BDV93DRAFT_517678 [Ceratobasidium sp. AG-I]
MIPHANAAAQEEPAERESSVSVKSDSIHQGGRRHSRGRTTEPYQRRRSSQQDDSEYYRVIKVEPKGGKPTWEWLGGRVVCMCTKSYKTEDNWTRHAKEHYRDKEYECKFCNAYRNERSDAMLKHARLCKSLSH